MLWLPKRTQLWACFNTEPNTLYRRLRLFPSKLQEYTPPPFYRLSTQYHIDPLLTCLLSLDTSRTSQRLQWSTKLSNRHTAHGRYEYSYNLANSRENWAQKKKSRPAGTINNCFDQQHVSDYPLHLTWKNGAFPVCLIPFHLNKF